ncbi:MAG: DUF1194 domain-containing protein [Paracoccaceae bacterium]
MSWAQTRDPDVELELVLLADTSGSIDRHEVEFQRKGYAAAISDPRVVAVIRNSAYGAIAVTYVEWGETQKVIVPWMRIETQSDADTFAKRIVKPPRAVGGKNAIGAALLLGKTLIEENEFNGWRRVVDISSDDARSSGDLSTEEARDQLVAAGITINGLPVPVLCHYCLGRASGRDKMLAAYREKIIGGPGSFVLMVEERSKFVDALRQKLILEIAGRTPEDGVQNAPLVSGQVRIPADSNPLR